MTTEWNAEHDQTLQSLEELFAATRASLEFLKAAKEYKVSPEEFQRLVGLEKIRQDKIMTRICDYAKANGGRVQVGKQEDGVYGRTAYWWVLSFDLGAKRKLMFTFQRCYEAEVYNVPLSHQWELRTKSGRKFVPEQDNDYHDCESVPEFKAYIKRALKWASDQLREKIEIKK